jgi:ATP-binding cassette subfamily C protein
MLSTLKKSLRFFKQRERIVYFTFLAARASLAVFDLVGILAIGLLATSMALFVSLGSDYSRSVELAGIEIPAINIQTLPIAGTIILGLFAGKAILSILLTKALAKFLAAIEARASREVVRSAFGGGLSAARRISREDIYFAVQVGCPSAFNSIPNSVATIISEGLLFVLVLVSFMVIDPYSALGAIIYFGLIALVIQFFLGRLLQAAGKRNMRGVIEANASIGDLGEVFREANLANKTSHFLDKVYDSRKLAASSAASQYVLNSMPRYIIETGLIFAVAIFGAFQLYSGDIVSAAGTLGIFLSGGLRLTASLVPLQGAFLTIRQSKPHALRAFESIELGTESNFGPKVSAFSPPASLKKMDVTLSNVTFTYPNSSKPSIENLNLTIKAGQQVALIGPSGAGKSTIADLVVGLLEPTSGTVEVGGQSPRVLIENFPGIIGYVPQRTGLVRGTIADNIALGVLPQELDYERLELVSRQANLQDLITDLPHGFATDLGQRQDGLSGGELQRIGLARALYNNPSMLVMDEATSSLDSISESEVNKALESMRGSVTVIVIAHRLHTIQKADLVCLVEKGTITASGVFSELLRSNLTVSNLAENITLDQGNSS